MKLGSDVFLDTRKRRWKRCVAGLWLLATLSGCRDGPEPYQPIDREPPAGRAWQLTYSVRDDGAPAWSAGGDSLYYSAEGYDHLPRTPGVLAALARDGGIVQTLLPEVQNAAARQRWLAAPAVSPDGDRIAFMDLFDLLRDPLCFAPRSCTPADAPPHPRLREVALRVRPLEADGPIELGSALRLPMEGIRVSASLGPLSFSLRLYPFQRLFSEEGAVALRPSWAPDGTRLAFSDGLQVRIWSIGEATSVPVPGTADGVWPAWSPDGEWIAFTWLERADSSGVSCTYQGPRAFSAQCVESRVDYTIGRRALMLVRPDGIDLRDLGEGEAPAWAPDSQSLYVRREQEIWRVWLDGRAERVPETFGGREPAISPGGRYLAFSRFSSPGNRNIWVIDLQARAGN